MSTKNTITVTTLRISFMMLAALLPGLIALGQVKFTTVVSSPKIGRKEVLQVEFVLENAKSIDRFTPPDFRGFRVMQEPSQSSQMSVINGSVSQSNTVTYTLQPSETGKLIIAGASAIVDGKEMRSNAITILVTEKSTGNGVNGNNGNPMNAFPQMSMPDPWSEAPRESDLDYVLKPGENVNEKIRKNLFLRVLVDKTSCYVGEPIVATYKLYSRLRSESSETKHPTLNGFSVYDMLDANAGAATVERVDGKPFTVHVLHKVQLIPLQARTVELDPIELENTVHFVKASGRRQSKNGSEGLRDLFDQLSDDQVQGPEIEEHLTLDTKPVSITVKPLPEENKPADFNGAVGKFTIEADLANRNISAQDEADLKVTVKGSGNLPVINAPQVAWPAGVNAFDPTAKEDINKMVAPMSGTKTFDFIFTPGDPGHYTIPPVAFSFFDPVARAYKHIQSNPLDFEVMAAVKKRAAPGGVSGASADRGGVKDFVERHLELLLSLLILSALAFYLWKHHLRLRKSQQEQEEKKKGIRAYALTMAERTEREAMAADPLPDVRQRLENGDYPGFYRELNRAIWKAVSDKLGLPASELNKYNIVRKLEAKGWDATTTLSLEHLLNECEMNLYTPDYDTYNMQQLLRQAESLLRVLISDTSY